MVSIVTWLVARGLSQRAAKAVAVVGGALAACALLASLAGLWLHFHDKGVIAEHDMAADLAAEKGAREADDHAAARRVEDATTNRDQEQAYADAIHSPAPGDSDDPAVRLACERLRRAGHDTAAIPGCGGR